MQPLEDMPFLMDLAQSTCVLVADDDPDDVFHLRRAFRRGGSTYEIIDMPDGEKTIEYLCGAPPFDDRLHYPLPRLLLLDLKLPKLNGFDVLAWIQGRPDLDKLPVVVLSSSPLDADADMAARLGARGFYTKPANADDLPALAARIRKRWLAEQCETQLLSLC